MCVCAYISICMCAYNKYVCVCIHSISLCVFTQHTQKLNVICQPDRKKTNGRGLLLNKK